MWTILTDVPMRVIGPRSRPWLHVRYALPGRAPSEPRHHRLRGYHDDYSTRSATDAPVVRRGPTYWLPRSAIHLACQ
jgi:hypothetical protein